MLAVLADHSTWKRVGRMAKWGELSAVQYGSGPLPNPTHNSLAPKFNHPSTGSTVCRYRLRAPSPAKQNACQ